jgi:ligand-binding sensor domain-containing protein
MLRRFLPAALRNRDAGWVSGGVTLQARNGEWWVGTGEGLFRFPALGDFTALETARPQVVYAERDGLTNPQVFRLFEDSQGGIWVSTISSQINGLARWEPDRQVFRSLAGTSGLSLPGNDLAHSFAEDGSGAVWIGFSGALARYRDGHFHPFTSEQGLPPGIIETNPFGPGWPSLARVQPQWPDSRGRFNGRATRFYALLDPTGTIE